MKRIICSALIVSLFFGPLSAIAAATPATTSGQFNPNVSITGGNKYSGISINGIGGAILSCVGVGQFLAGAESSLFKSATSKITGSASSYIGGGSNNAVATVDKSTNDKLETANKTTTCLDGIAYAVAKNTLAQVTNKTLNWVNHGLQGNPLYVQNSTSYLQSPKNKELDWFLQNDPYFGNATQKRSILLMVCPMILFSAMHYVLLLRSR